MLPSECLFLLQVARISLLLLLRWDRLSLADVADFLRHHFAHDGELVRVVAALLAVVAFFFFVVFLLLHIVVVEIAPFVFFAVVRHALDELGAVMLLRRCASVLLGAFRSWGSAMGRIGTFRRV